MSRGYVHFQPIFLADKQEQAVPIRTRSPSRPPCGGFKQQERRQFTCNTVCPPAAFPYHYCCQRRLRHVWLPRTPPPPPRPPPFARATPEPCRSNSNQRCFLKFWNCGIWRFLFLEVDDDHVFSVIVRLGDGILGMLVAALPPIFTASCPLEVGIGESPDDWYIHDANGHRLCLLTARAHNARVRAT